MHCVEIGTPSTIEIKEHTDKVATYLMHIKKFLEDEKLTDGEVDATGIKNIAPNYLIIDGMLYKKGYSTPYLRCIARPNSYRIFREMHKWFATCLEGARSMIRKALRQVYYWLTIMK